MKLIRFFFACAILCFSLAAQAQQKTRLTEGWEFLKQDVGGIWEAVRPVKPGNPESVPIWTKVTLPHCVNAEDAVDPDVNYYQGPAWYRTQLAISNPYPKGRTLLHFEGAGQKTSLYIYNGKIADHIGGYDEWTADITDAVAQFLKSPDAARFNGKVPVSIRTDNSRDLEMIPSDLSDFNLYGGLYRYVNLIYQPALSVDKLFATPFVDESGKSGKVSVTARFHNPDNLTTANATLSLFDTQGKLVHKDSSVLSNLSGDVVLPSFSVKRPRLWSPDQPGLYTLRLQITTPRGSSVHEEKIGFRSFEFVDHGPFKLNGTRLLLRGTHRHEDHAGVGAAMTEAMIRREMIMMKEMGVNFIRLGHYQQSRIVLNLCDSLGILVWEEIPWCRGGLGGETYKQQARTMLTNLVEQHYNHPAVIIWGLGNENDWPGDFEEFDQQKIRAFMAELNNLAHSLDATRKTAIRRCDFCKDIVDVYSPSIWAGWYRGQYTEYKAVSEEEMKKVKHFLHVEWGGDSHARRHAENPDKALKEVLSGKGADERAGDASLFGGPARVSKDGDWSETYICNLIDWHLKEQETMPWLSGTAYWPFKDFSTPVRPENPVPYVNQKGVVERDFTKKEAYYVFQSWWTTEPMVHIYGHTWPVRWGDAGEEKLLKAYSNCDEVELFVNGVSLGRRKRNSQDFPAAGLRWNAKLKPGENSVRAVGYKGKVIVEDQLTFLYETRKWNKPAALKLRKVSEENSMVTVEAELVDAQGIRCLDARDFVRFSLAGDGDLIDNQGTSDGSRYVQLYNGRALISMTAKQGSTVVGVSMEGLPAVWLSL